jgi:hypothetical protein
MDVLCTEHPQLKRVSATQLAEYVNFDELPALQVRASGPRRDQARMNES